MPQAVCCDILGQCWIWKFITLAVRAVVRSGPDTCPFAEAAVVRGSKPREVFVSEVRIDISVVRLLSIPAGFDGEPTLPISSCRAHPTEVSLFPIVFTRETSWRFREG